MNDRLRKPRPAMAGSECIRDRCKVLARFERDDKAQTRDVSVTESSRVWSMHEQVLPTVYGVDEASLKETLRELVRVDVANITPVQALVILHELQKRIDGITF